MIEIVEQQKKLKTNVQPRTYHCPRLHVYGSLRELTAGGSGVASENNQGGVKPRP